MIKRSILECMSLAGSVPEQFEGAKTYVSTGALDLDYRKNLFLREVVA